MANAFIHKYELVIGSPANLLKSTQNTETAPPAPSSLTQNDSSDVVVGGGSDSGYSDYSTVPSGAITLTDLQIEASIDYNIAPAGKNSQPAVIKVFNLSDTTINFITAESSVILRAGYQKDEALPAIYTGQVVKVSTERVGPDYVTTLVCSDGANILKNAKYFKTYPKNTTYENILSDLISQFVSKGIVQGDFTVNERTSKAITRALVREGSLSASLSAVCNEIDYGWYITLGKLNVHPKEQNGLIESVDIIETNVKGVISQNDDKSSTSTFSKASKPQGIKLTTFLNGNITTNTTLKVKFGDYQGDYKIQSVSHKLNFRGDAWDTEIECQRIP
jgi:hypothetical protein